MTALNFNATIHRTRAVGVALLTTLIGFVDLGRFSMVLAVAFAIAKAVYFSCTHCTSSSWYSRLLVRGVI